MKTPGQWWILAVLPGFLFSGCGTTAPSGSISAPRLDPPPFKQIGKIASIDPGSSTVVVRLAPGNSTLPDELFVRNTNNEITARIRPTGIRTGRSVGMVLLQGQVNLEDEVVKRSDP